MAWTEVDPISRIEGHLGVNVSTATGADGEVITDAEMHGNLWRGFENFLLGRDVNDAITFTQRICGVCPVPHGQTATFAADAVLGYSNGHISFIGDVPEKAVHIRNLVLSAEFLMSSMTHFYHLVVLDYVQGPATPPWTPFFTDLNYHTALLNPTAGTYSGSSTSAGALPTTTEGFSRSLWDAGVTQYVKALRMRRLTFEAGALFAGRMPMTSCFVGGGVTDDGTEDLTAKCTQYKTIMEEVGQFIIKEYVPIVLALGALYPDYENSNGTNGGADGGAGWGNFLAWGAFPHKDASGNDVLGLPGGVYITDDVGTGTTGFTVTNKTEMTAQFLPGGTNAVADNLTETIANSRYAISTFDTANIDAGTGKAFPGDVQRTMPDRGAGYSYIKSPRWNDVPCEVGPFARMVIAGFIDPTGSTYLSTADSASIGVAGYDAYAKTVNATLGLDPAMVGPDLAVGLIWDGLATLDMWDGSGWTIVSQANIATFDNATILAAYTSTSVYGDAIISGTVTNWVVALSGGLSAMDRIRARAIESLYLVQKMIGTYSKATFAGSFGADGWVDDLAGAGGLTWAAPGPISANSNYGATEAPRGALAHFATINSAAKITAYQCVVPTTWNAGPKDNNSNNGPIEKAIIGVVNNEFGDQTFTVEGSTSGAITGKCQLEALRVTHTFDPCIACAVH